MQHNPQGPQQPQDENRQRRGAAAPQPPGTYRYGQEPPYAPTGASFPTKPQPKRRGRLVAEIVGAVVLLSIGIGIGAGGGSEPVAAPAPTATRTVTEPGPVETVEVEVPGPETTVTVTAQPPKPKEPKGFGEGMYLVGDDIKPGRYKTAGPADTDFPNCYWARLKGTTGSLDDIAANGNPEGPSFVTIKSSDEAFETSGCKDWVKVS